ncbi:hypothetical protein SASPL_145876 [Salvia splendens]|uniref:Superkiller protein 3 n=2 Tax=Salvia splendens TaxID=180675 RepID=A0A8X8WH91_SALSN|nr:protein NPGR2-like isoform X2 [Salvia splendens]XP_042028120.1 protein NPGR2-like isoform X2 [Salvia splendens]KAG6395235.1 hypothetical protein SASPL_145876 [Salvia splendens]
MSIKYWLYKQKNQLRSKLGKMMKCICSSEQLQADEGIPASSESLATRDYSASGFSSRAGDADTRADTSNIEEAESSLRESGFLNYEEARALLGRLEYQKGNVEAALTVFEGIDVAAVIPRIKATIVRRCELPRRHSQSNGTPPMSMHAVSLLVEAIFLKAKSLQVLGRYKEAAQTCSAILDTFESAIPEGLPEKFASDCKLLETLNKAVELLPDLWKLAFGPQEAILSYRRALLYQWDLDVETRTRIEKDFAVFLLYSGHDASAPNLRSQMDDSYIPRNNVEEAVLLLLLILKKIFLKRVGWDPSIIYHLGFALSIAGECRSLTCQIEDLHPGFIERREKYTSLALCYHAEGDDSIALNLLRNLLNNRENRFSCEFELLLASKICTENSSFLEEGMQYIHKLLVPSEKCHERASVANHLLGLSLSAQSRGMGSDAQRISLQSEALEALETAQKMTRGMNPNILLSLSLENAEQRKLDAALYYTKQLLALEGGSNIKCWILLVRILSAQKRYVDAEIMLDAALDEAGKWDHPGLLRTKAKLQIVQGHLTDAVETYTKLLAVLQVQRKSFQVHKLLLQDRQSITSLELETWHDLANVYASLSQWRDAEICLSKSEAINPHSASRLHSAGLLYEAKGMQKEALKSFEKALDIDPNHIQSLISTAVIVRQLSEQSVAVAKSFLTDALRLDRSNHTAWYNLGLIYKSESSATALECFEAAAMLQESEPIEPFR